MKNLKGGIIMKIAYGEVKDAKWVLDAKDDFRTLVITNGRGKEEKLQFRLEGRYGLYLYCKDGKPYDIGHRMLYIILSYILTFIADSDDVDDAINEIMIALL